MDLHTFLFIVFVLLMIQSTTRKKKKRVPPKPQQPAPPKKAKGQPLNPHIREALERFENRMKSQSQPQTEQTCAGPTISDEPLHTTEKDEIHPINPTVKEDLTTLSTSVKEDLKPQVAEAPEPGESSETKPRTRSRRSKVREGIIWSVILERKY